MEWYNNSIIMTFLGVVLGGIISVLGTFINAGLKIKETNLQHENELRRKNIEQKKEIYENMILLTNSQYLQDVGNTDFEKSSTLLLAKARIYCNNQVAALYEEYINDFLYQNLDSRELIENRLLPAIRKDLGINK